MRRRELGEANCREIWDVEDKREKLGKIMYEGCKWARYRNESRGK